MRVFSIPLRTRFRGITVREGVLIEGPAGWGEWSPFTEYDAPTARPWLRAAEEAAAGDWPAPLRDAVPVNVTVPACSPERAHAIVRAGGCTTAKVKVAEVGQTLGDDEARLEAVRDALGPAGSSASTPTAAGTSTRRWAPSGCWSGPPAAWSTSSSPARASRSWPPCAARSTCPSPPTSRSGGPRTPTGCATWRPPTSRCSRCSRWAACAPACGSPRTSACRSWSPAPSSPASASRPGSRWPPPCPELPHACGLATVQLLTDDVVIEPLLPVDGMLPVRTPVVDPAALDRLAADPDRVAWWERRLAAVRQDRPS